MRNLMNKFRSFAADKSGAVTVDWVALTAAVVVIGIALVYAVFGADNTTGFSGVANTVTTESNALTTDLQGIAAAAVTPQIGGGTTTTTTGGN